LPELIALARAQSGSLAHAGAGTSQHLAAELLKSFTQIDIQPVAYRGTTALLPDLLAGRVTMSFANIVNAAPLIREGKLRAFAVTSLKRSAVAPDLPTMAESGYPGFSGAVVRADGAGGDLARDHRQAPSRDREFLLADVRKKLNELGLDVVGNSPTEFSAVIARNPQWAKVIKGAGIRLSE
jgi:tripartite-type tricarboxylate transporter receptor subunit TctC